MYAVGLQKNGGGNGYGRLEGWAPVFKTRVCRALVWRLCGRRGKSLGTAYCYRLPRDQEPQVRETDWLDNWYQAN